VSPPNAHVSGRRLYKYTPESIGRYPLVLPGNCFTGCGRPNAGLQRRRWRACEARRADGTRRHGKQLPGSGPRQRRPLRADVGPLIDRIEDILAIESIAHICTVNTYTLHITNCSKARLLHRQTIRSLQLAKKYTYFLEAGSTAH
jgi:hypothetical protein